MNTTTKEKFLNDCIVVARMLQPALTGKELAKKKGLLRQTAEWYSRRSTSASLGAKTIHTSSAVPTATAKCIEWRENDRSPARPKHAACLGRPTKGRPVYLCKALKYSRAY